MLRRRSRNATDKLIISTIGSHEEHESDFSISDLQDMINIDEQLNERGTTTYEMSIFVDYFFSKDVALLETHCRRLFKNSQNRVAEVMLYLKAANIGVYARLFSTFSAEKIYSPRFVSLSFDKDMLASLIQYKQQFTDLAVYASIEELRLALPDVNLKLAKRDIWRLIFQQARVSKRLFLYQRHGSCSIVSQSNIIINGKFIAFMGFSVLKFINFDSKFSRIGLKEICSIDRESQHPIIVNFKYRNSEKYEMTKMVCRRYTSVLLRITIQSVDASIFEHYYSILQMVETSLNQWILLLEAFERVPTYVGLKRLLQKSERLSVRQFPPSILVEAIIYGSDYFAFIKRALY